MKASLRQSPVLRVRRGVGSRRPVGAALGAVLLLGAALALGCVTAYTQCDYDPLAATESDQPKAVLTEVTAWSSVWGKGTIDNDVKACKTLEHKSSGTGVSEGAVKLGEAALKLTPTGAGTSVIEKGIDALDDDPPLP